MPNNSALAGTFDSKEYAWKDMSFALLSGTVVGIQELTYTKTRDTEEVYGAGDEPLAISRKNKKYAGQIMLLRSEYDKIDAAARTAGYDDLLDLPAFPVNCRYSNDTKITDDTLMGAVFDSFNLGGKQGDGYMTVTLPFKFTKLKRK